MGEVPHRLRAPGQSELEDQDFLTDDILSSATPSASCTKEKEEEDCTFNIEEFVENLLEEKDETLHLEDQPLMWKGENIFNSSCRFFFAETSKSESTSEVNQPEQSIDQRLLQEVEMLNHPGFRNNTLLSELHENPTSQTATQRNLPRTSSHAEHNETGESQFLLSQVPSVLTTEPRFLEMTSKNPKHDIYSRLNKK